MTVKEFVLFLIPCILLSAVCTIVLLALGAWFARTWDNATSKKLVTRDTPKLKRFDDERGEQ